MWKLMHTPVADRDLQISGWWWGEGGGGVGGGYPDSEIRGARWSQNKYFSALPASFWSKNKGGWPGPQASPLDPPCPPFVISIENGWVIGRGYFSPNARTGGRDRRGKRRGTFSVPLPPSPAIFEVKKFNLKL